MPKNNLDSKKQDFKAIVSGLSKRKKAKTIRDAIRAYFDVFDSKENKASKKECARLLAQSLDLAAMIGSRKAKSV